MNNDTNLFVIDQETYDAVGFYVIACPMTGESHIFSSAEEVRVFLECFYTNPIAAKFAAIKTLYERL